MMPCVSLAHLAGSALLDLQCLVAVVERLLHVSRLPVQRTKSIQLGDFISVLFCLDCLGEILLMLGNFDP